MEISIFGFKFRLEILILIVVVYWIMAGHLLCSCATFPLMEGAATMASTIGTKALGDDKKHPKNHTKKESFVGLINDGESSAYTLGSYNGVIMPTSKWGRPNLTVVPGKPLSQGVQNILNREKQPVPLPDGELNMFETTPFKPECCPNAYSNSSGCACMTVDQYNYLITRGGNNVPYSEY
jgi:hypothetical protein